MNWPHTHEVGGFLSFDGEHTIEDAKILAA